MWKKQNYQLTDEVSGFSILHSSTSRRHGATDMLTRELRNTTTAEPSRAEPSRAEPSRTPGVGGL
ncbi:MAG: hypothetical protein MUF18_21740 [Fimbriiglobus sp.]|nr:hypothetical protein [Fimbriiglobus sp.]